MTEQDFERLGTLRRARVMRAMTQAEWSEYDRLVAAVRAKEGMALFLGIDRDPPPFNAPPAQANDAAARIAKAVAILEAADGPAVQALRGRVLKALRGES